MNNSQRDTQIRQWAMIVHFSLLAIFIAPIGLIAPVIIWQIKKYDLPEINPHGKVVTNWIISVLLYSILFYWVVFLRLVPTFLGSIFEFISFYMKVPFFSGDGIISLFAAIFTVLSMIGGIKAGNGKVWRYPFSLPILK